MSSQKKLCLYNFVKKKISVRVSVQKLFIRKDIIKNNYASPLIQDLYGNI